jgi:hypothetical protein
MRTFAPWLLLAPVAVLALVHCSEDDKTSAPRRTVTGAGAPDTDAGGTDAGLLPRADASTSPDGASPPADAGTNANPCAGKLLCADFEQDPVGAPPGGPWEAKTNKGAVVVDTAMAFSGKHSVKVTTQAGSYQQAFISTKSAAVFPAASGLLYGRMMVYMDSTAKDGVHWTQLQATGPVPGLTGVTGYYRYGGQHQGKLMANYETVGKSTDCWQHSATVMPTKKWVCMEWAFDASQEDMRFWLDGAELSDLHVSHKGQGCIGNDLAGVWKAPTFDTLSLGWESYQQDDARTGYIDDVVIDKARVGCPAAK